MSIDMVKHCFVCGEKVLKSKSFQSSKPQGINKVYLTFCSKKCKEVFKGKEEGKEMK